MTDYALAVLAYFMLMVGAAIIGMWLQKKIDRLSSLEEHHRQQQPEDKRPYGETISFREALERYPTSTACGSSTGHAWRDENGNIHEVIYTEQKKAFGTMHLTKVAL